jgi:hypothetical protein
MAALGSPAHQALIGQLTGHYENDARVRAIVVFGSVSTGEWHALSDVDLDIVIEDGTVIDPEAEARAIFGSQAAIVISGHDSADIVLDSLAEASIRWHPLSATSPNITASLRLVAGRLPAAQIAAAGEANRAGLDEERLLDTLVREAIGAWKANRRGRPWEAVAAVERARRALTTLRGRRDGLLLDPADPAGALAAVLAEAARSADFGPVRGELLARLGLGASGTPHPFG